MRVAGYVDVGDAALLSATFSTTRQLRCGLMIAAGSRGWSGASGALAFLAGNAEVIADECEWLFRLCMLLLVGIGAVAILLV